MNRARDYHMALGGSAETWAAILNAMVEEQEKRHPDIIRAGEQIRRWREEDKALSNTVKGISDGE